MVFIPRSLTTAARNQRGQAIFELLVFMPFLVFFFITMMTIGNAINSSINQQKVTRSYFMYTIKQNPMIPLRNSLDFWLAEGYTIAGLYSFGFRAKASEGGNLSFSPCYKMSTTFGGGDEDETCDDPVQGSNLSKFIRVYTFYGVCGETFFNIGSANYYTTFRYIPGFERQMGGNHICTFGNGGN